VVSNEPQLPVKSRRYSSGILAYRQVPDGVEVLLGHMGGPMWSTRDHAAWSIPKGGYDAGEDAFDAARREFTEEVGLPVPDGDFVPLGEVLQANNKVVTAWAVAAPELDADSAVSNTFELEWPPHSGRRQAFPEFDVIRWVGVDTARVKLVAAQVAYLDRLLAHLTH
jgi:predicted NUDIX family NTP pyrophosphohydrolase